MNTYDFETLLKAFKETESGLVADLIQFLIDLDKAGYEVKEK